jgi:hypothetical protein
MQNKQNLKLYPLHFYKSEEEDNGQPILYAVFGTHDKKQRKRPFYVPVVYKGTMGNFKQFGSCIKYDYYKPKENIENINGENINGENINEEKIKYDTDYPHIHSGYYYYILDNMDRLKFGMQHEDGTIRSGRYGYYKHIKLQYLDNIELTIPYPDETELIKYLNDKIKKHKNMIDHYETNQRPFYAHRWDNVNNELYTEKLRKSLIRRNIAYVNHYTKLLQDNL